MNYRGLTDYEIEALTNQRCTADNWSNIEVVPDFSTKHIEGVRFSGYNTLGLFNKVFKIDNGQRLHSGIYNAKIHNTIIEDDVYISNVNDVIANYEIREGCFISNLGTLSCLPESTFGNGTMVSAVNENGGRKIPIFNYLSSQLAYILVFYRHKKSLLDAVFCKIEQYSDELKKQSRGIVGQESRLVNCRTILNINIGSSALISGVEHLENGSIISKKESQTFVGEGVIAKDFIFASGSTITEKSIIERCFIGEGSCISKGFSAVDCLIFSNCEFANGEAVSMFAGPYSVSHHKSSLVIACALSFANVGSGTNMSNHAYKLGAIHQSVTHRGCKFGSNSYLLSPTHIGDYTMILGDHKNHPNTEEFPFSYLIEDQSGESILIPGVNIFRVGTMRDVGKWQTRDRRSSNHLDMITYEMLNPYIINKIENAITILNQLQLKETESPFYHYKSCKIHKHSLKKSIDYYHDAITIFLGDNLLREWNYTEGNNSCSKGYNKWVDLGGLIMPKEPLDDLLDSPNAIDITDNHIFADILNNYNKYLNVFLHKRYNLWNSKNKRAILLRYIDVMQTIEQRMRREANSEFFGDSQIGYGIDFPDQMAVDFAEVTNTTRNNHFWENILTQLKQKISDAKNYVEKS